MQADTFHFLQGESPPIESWDDDEDLHCPDDAQFHAMSTTTSVTGSMMRSGHRDSISSRLSVRSDVESNAGDEDWQLLLQDDNDETATEEAIASARSAGIPIPDNVPKSALLSGSIKKLSFKQNKKSAIDDWSEDLEFPVTDLELTIKPSGQGSFPESIQPVQTPMTTSPGKAKETDDYITFGASHALTHSSSARGASHGLTDLKDLDTRQDLQDFLKEDSTVAHSNPPQTPRMASRTPPVNVMKDTEDFEKDFEFPAHDMMLKLSPPPPITATIPSINDDIWDNIDWADGSIGGRFSGTKRDGRSTHSSSVSAFSPSASSCLTVETEDDGLDGLVLPDGPLNLEENLKKRKVLRTDSDEISPKTQRRPKHMIDSHSNNFFDELDVDDGNVFSSMKPNVNRNVKRKLDRPMTPNRSEKTITFTNKTPSTTTRIPRLSGHNRSHTSLEPVSESGNPVLQFRRPQSRLTAHTNRSSVGSIHTSPPVTPPGGRRSLGSRLSREGTTTNDSSSHAQFLKAKRSVPSVRAPEESGPAPPFQRPSSRQDSASTIPVYSRPKTPVDRTTIDSRLTNHRAPAPFLPAGASQTQSHHVSLKYSRHFRRSDSENSTDSTIGSKSMSRLSYPRSDTPSRHHAHSASEGSNITAKRTMTRPTRRRNYGDGTELESLDDLPTSAMAESRFVKSPVGHGAPRSIRSRLPQSPTTASARTETPTPPITSVPSSSSRSNAFTPRFARDTNASRIAREQRIASLSLPSRNRESTPLGPLTSNWKGNQPPRQSDAMLTVRSKKGKASRPGGSRPQLIRPMGSGVNEAKHVKGMQYNPNTYRWEGNENEVADFDAIKAPKSPKVARALITNIGTIKGAQVVGGMVFDPQRMCWLKLASAQPDADKVAVIHDELEDVFAGLEDLQDRSEEQSKQHHRRNISEASATATDVFEDQSGDSSEEWPITEEFDVGPEFVKRQRAEEDRWKRKVTKWVTTERQKLGDGWRWAIRDLVPSQN